MITAEIFGQVNITARVPAKITESLLLKACEAVRRQMKVSVNCEMHNFQTSKSSLQHGPVRVSYGVHGWNFLDNVQKEPSPGN